MAAQNGPHQLARSVIDDLIDFSGETSVEGYMSFFKQHQISNLRGYVNRMRKEATKAMNEIGQITALIAEIEDLGDEELYDTLMDLRADREAVKAKLEGLNELITEADEQIEVKEEQVQHLTGWMVGWLWMVSFA